MLYKEDEECLIKGPYYFFQWFQFPQGVILSGEKCRTNETSFLFKTKGAFWAPESTGVPFNIKEWNLLLSISKLIY